VLCLLSQSLDGPVGRTTKYKAPSTKYRFGKVMSFLNKLIPDPKYQTTVPRNPEEIGDQEIIISPDTRRDSRIPPGQSRTKKWPVLDAHGTPEIDLATWSFEVDGLVEHAQQWSLDEFMQLPAVRVYADFHCVTRWSRLDNVWGGVPTREVARIVGIKPEARFVVAQAYDDGWTTNVPIEYFLKEDSLFAWSHDGAPIPPEHGGPVRLIIPQLYAWKSAKWVKGVRFLAQDQAGFWEEGGYHMRGDPWASGDGERFRWS
jgi:DMSO/TMAO reductase YedYZ molybdopterin-dependent catalytic subunit